MSSDVENTVIALQGNPVKREVLGPSEDGYVLTWDNADGEWEALPTAGAFTAGGDLAGTSSSQQVISLTGNSGVVNIASTGNILTWDAATTNPGITQVSIASGQGTDLTITAQGTGDDLGGSVSGGNLNLLPGPDPLGINSGANVYIGGTSAASYKVPLIVSRSTVFMPALANSAGEGLLCLIGGNSSVNIVNDGDVLMNPHGSNPTYVRSLSGDIDNNNLLLVQCQIQYTQSTIDITAGGTFTISGSQLLTPALIFTGSTAGATIIDFGGAIGTWYLDFSGATLNPAGTTITNGTGSFTATTLLTTKTLLTVMCNSANTVAVG